MVASAYMDGQKLGEKIADAIKSGELIIPDNETMEIMIDKFISYDFIAYQKLIAKVISISPNIYVVGHFICAGGGIMISGASLLNFYKTKNPIARTCYTISAVCGGSAAVGGAFAGVNTVFGLSPIAAGGDIIGGAFLWLGNKAKKVGDFVDGKKSFNPFRRRNFMRRPISKQEMGYKGMSFVTGAGTPMDISFDDIFRNIPYQSILIIGGTVFTVYSYGKFIIAIYRYVNKKFSPKIDHSRVIFDSARFLINSLNENEVEYSKKVNRIYTAALQLHVSS